MGPRLTTPGPPRAAPGELFAGDAATLKSEHYPAIFAASFVGGVIPTSYFVNRQARRQPLAISTRASR
jgi:hypothetical protein